MAAGHDQEHGQQAGNGQRVPWDPGRSQPAITRGTEGVQVLGDPKGINRRDESIHEGDEIEDEDGAQQQGVEDQSDELDPVQPQHDPCEERDQQDRRRGKGEGATRRARYR
jgi:hypothetical protein